LRVVFLDRDGVINQDSPNYIKSLEEFRFLPRTLDALALLARNGYTTAVVTNQSGIARGLFTPETLAEMHARMREEVARAGGRLSAVVHCPHHPDDNCPCRKPRPGMLLKAARELGADLSRAVMVGDNIKDIKAARAAGCGLAILVRTGSGRGAEAKIAREGGPVPDYVADDLCQAVEWLLAHDGRA
jgi:D-glycero-D-manno-heptose 1,7-bisphosphate phosphatase